MDTSTYDGMRALCLNWLPAWRVGRRLGMLRIFVENARVYNFRWPSHDSRECLDLLLQYLVKFSATSAYKCGRFVASVKIWRPYKQRSRDNV